MEITEVVTVKDVPNGSVEETWELQPVVLMFRTRTNVNGEVIQRSEKFFIGSFTDATAYEFLTGSERRILSQTTREL